MTSEGYSQEQPSRQPELQKIPAIPEVDRGNPLLPDLVESDVDAFIEKHRQQDEERRKQPPPPTLNS